MNLKHLQLNSSLLRSPEKITDFLVDNQIDVASFQEICYPIGKVSPLKALVESKKYFYVEGVHFHYHPNNQTIATAIVSRFPILDSHTWYFNSPSFSPKDITASDQLFPDLINNNFPNFPASRGLINEIKSRCILSALVQTPSGLVRFLTTHFTVSDLCVETSQMYQMSLMINSIVKNSTPIPTIFSADLNIRPQSYSVTKISEVLTCHTADFTDTLSPSHKVKQNNIFPEGLAVDHVFSKNIRHLDTKEIVVDFSEHQAIISDFEI
ncbi:MAG: hypothetical protein WCV93_00855 [Candidatus Shapirobacteria bacterium]|jgi:hypothetical protein